MYDDFREDELERAYKRGCEHGYKKAMEEMGEYGERGGGSSSSSSRYGQREGFGGRSWTISEGVYGQRDDSNYDTTSGGYGERRRRDSRGRYM